MWSCILLPWKCRVYLSHPREVHINSLVSHIWVIGIVEKLLVLDSLPPCTLIYQDILLPIQTSSRLNQLKWEKMKKCGTLLLFRKNFCFYVIFIIFSTNFIYLKVTDHIFFDLNWEFPRIYQLIASEDCF